MLTDYPIDPQLIAAIEDAFKRSAIELVDMPGELSKAARMLGKAGATSHRRDLRTMVIERDGDLCLYCQVPFAEGQTRTLDHLIPNSLSRSWKVQNLVLACESCNNAKDDKIPAVLLPLLLTVLARQARYQEWKRAENKAKRQARERRVSVDALTAIYPRYATATAAVAQLEDAGSEVARRD